MAHLTSSETMNPSPSDVASAALRDDPLDDSLELDPELMIARVLADPCLVQHVVRTNRDGVETVVAYFRCVFSRGLQRYVLHVPFSPAFVGIPVVSAMATEHADVRVRITDCQKFGARLEVVLPQPSDCETSLLVEVIATTQT